VENQKPKDLQLIAGCMPMIHRDPMGSDLINRVLDGHYGIIHDLHASTIIPNGPEIFVYGAKTANSSAYFLVKCNEDNSGAGITQHDAISAAVGEVIERYCSAGWDPSELIYGTYNDLNKEFNLISPNDFHYFDKSQKEALSEFAPFTKNTYLAWIPSYSLIRKTQVLVPASVVFLPFKALFKQQGEQIIAPSYSTGLSCGASRPEALYHCLCECVERDAFMNLWNNRLSIPHVNIKSDPEIKDLFERYFERENLEYIIVNSTTDIKLTAINCFLVDYAYSPPLIAVSGSASLSAKDAIIKAILEAAHTYYWACTLRQDTRDYQEDFSDVLDFQDHIRLHASGKFFRAFDFILKKSVSCQVGELCNYQVSSYKEALWKTVAILNDAGQESYAVDLTTPDIEDLGLAVTRTFVPGLIQLNSGHHRRQLGIKRLFTLPCNLGYTAKETTIADINPLPHPYP